QRAVLLADGSVQQLSSAQFEERARRGWILPATPQQAARNQQVAAVRGAQFQPATVQPLPGNPGNPGNDPAAVPNFDARASKFGPEDNGVPAPLVPRARAFRIDIPREGQAFTFTKVLNLGGQ